MIRNFLTTNIWLKLASIILAVALWFFVMSSGRSVVVMDVPVKYINIPPTLEMVDRTKSVSIGIEGQERLLKRLNRDNISVVADLAKVKAGKNLHPISRKDIDLPKRLLITSISPQSINLILEKRLKKDVSIKPVIVGLPAEGFAVESIKIEPKRVQIEGPKSIIRRIYTIKTEPIDIAGIDQNMQHSVYLDMTTPNLRTEIQEIKVDITLRKKR